MEFWNQPQPSVAHDHRQNKRQGPNIIDSRGAEMTPMLLTRQKEPVSILVTENAHMGEELGQDGTELATAIVQAKIVVEVEHRTYHAGCYNRKCWMWFFIFLLQFTGLNAENCTVWSDHGGSYFEVLNAIIGIGLSSHHTIECPHGCCGEWRDVCCEEQKVEPAKAEPANETLTMEPPEPLKNDPPVAEPANKETEEKADSFYFIAFGILLLFVIIIRSMRKSKPRKRR
ncbi:uncharacterized protein LOC131953254 [Physella acuta]|uniref:uncharacterized protein LOC131953254 n=1 Tax=Physella acuta TaxID=109671 RepID=UPI0027DB544B|nr:uncharacterized protein LOC131953254 [Physella acuta]